MKSRKLLFVAAFLVAAASAWATRTPDNLLNNRRNASCQPITGTCVESGLHDCTEVQQYDINDTNCQTRFNKKP